MRRNLIVALFVVVAWFEGRCVWADAPPASAGTLIVGAKILNLDGDGWLTGQAVLVRNGNIDGVGPEALLKPSADARRINLESLYVLPGLIDLHTHLLLHPYNEAKWDDQVLRESLESRVIRATAAARATLAAGFTTIRDLGTEGAGVADVALRDSIARGMIPGPRVITSTRAIVASWSYGPAGFDPRWRPPQGAQEATGVDEMRRVVREQLALGADWIKVYADYHRGPGSPTTATLTLEEIAVAVDEAHTAGKPVAAHATTDEGIRRAVMAGVKTIEHGYGASRETLALMKQTGVTLCPTLAAAEAVARYAGWKAEEAGAAPAGVAESRASFRLALEVGVTIACGSDAGVFAHGQNAWEIELMVGGGMTPAQGIRAATATAATVLGREKDLGRIAPGFVADLVAFRADPLADVHALRDVRWVMKDGKEAGPAR